METIRCHAVCDVQLEKREIDPITGFLRAPATVARTGVQRYTAGELGLDKKMGLPPGKVLRLMRLPQEVFAADSLASFDQAPVTINHPPADVDADNWRDYAVGEAYGMKQSGDLVKGTLCVKDRAAVQAVRDGKAQISAGYDFNLDMTPGVKDGEEYDAVMRDVRVNHVAIVDAARGGPRLRVFDKENPMSTETARVKIGKLNVRVVDSEAQAAQDAVDHMAEELSSTKGELAKARDAVTSETAKATDAATALATEKAAHAATVTAKDAEIAELKTKVPAAGAIEAAAEARLAAIVGATRVVDGFDAKGKTTHQVRVAALDAATKNDGPLKAVAAAVLGGELAKADEATVAKAFDAVIAALGAADAGRDAAAADAMSGHLAEALAGMRGGVRAADAKPIGRDAHIARVTAESRKTTKAA